MARGRFFSAVEQLSRTCSSSSCETASRLKDFDKARYGSLVHPGDSYSYDIFTQAADALRHPTNPNPLGGLPIRKMIAEGSLKTKGEKRSTAYFAGAKKKS